MRRLAAVVVIVGLCVVLTAAWSLLSPIRTDRTTARPGDPTASCGSALNGREDDESCVDVRYNRRNEWLPVFGGGVLILAAGAAAALATSRGGGDGHKGQAMTRAPQRL